MNYNRKIMRLELSAENPVHDGYYYAELLLPAADYEIKDVMQKARAVGRENTVEVSILECDILPELQDIRLDTFSLDELNFLAKRLASLPDAELPVFYAVTEQIFNDADENPVSIKDLINCTYGLDTVPVAHNRILLIVRADRAKQPMIKSQVYKLFSGKAILRVENTTQDTVELIYELTQKMVRNAEKGEINITDSIYKLENIEYVNLVMQNDEISN